MGDIHLPKTATLKESKPEGEGVMGIIREGRDRGRRVMVLSQTTGKICHCHTLASTLGVHLNLEAINNCTHTHTPMHSCAYKVSLTDVQDKVTDILKDIFR